MRALIQRLNRCIGSKVLHTARGKAAQTVGPHYVVDGKKVVETNVNLEQYGRALGCLKDWERLV